MPLIRLLEPLLMDCVAKLCLLCESSDKSRPSAGRQAYCPIGERNAQFLARLTPLISDPPSRISTLCKHSASASPTC